MPVYKYKTFEEARRDQWNFHPDEKYWEMVKNLFDAAADLNDFKHPRGVFKFKTFEDAQADLDRRIIEYAIQKREQRLKSGN